MSGLAEWSIADPGAGRRLAAEARQELAAAIRGWGRGDANSIVVHVEDAAWAAVPDGAGDLSEHSTIVAAQELVAALFGVRQPLVASIDGPVTGLGLAVLLCADVRIGGPQTTIAIGDNPHAALIGGGRWLAAHIGAIAAWDRMAGTGAVLDRDSAVATGLLTAAGDRTSARNAAQRLGSDAGWASVKRAARSRLRAELSRALRYEGWLATPS